MRIFIIFVCIALFPVSNFAQMEGKNYSLLQSKIFPLFSAMKNDKDFVAVLKKSPKYIKILELRLIDFKNATNNCNINADCFLKSMRYDSTTINLITSNIVDILKENPALFQKFALKMRQSGNYALYANGTNEEMIISSLTNSYKALDELLVHYVTNKGFTYPNIDSAIYTTNTLYYNQLIAEILIAISDYRKEELKFDFELPLILAMNLLEINNRDEAIRFYPLSNANKAAYDKIPKVYWKTYQYSSILVLGEGPEMDNIPLSQHSKLRCRIAAEEFKLHKAPFIIVSGGYVHPFQTKYCEAEEMRKFLTDDCGIPISAIIIDPHARHTTTNIRNANRILFQNSIAPEMKVLCISSRNHIDYIQSARFIPRCKEELGYVPFNRMKRLNAFTVEYFTERLSLTANPYEPLDP